MSEELEVRWRRARAWLERVRAASSRIEPLVREIDALKDARTEMLPWQTGKGGGGSGVGAHSDPTATQAERRIEGLDELIADRQAKLDAQVRTVGDCGMALEAMAGRLGERHAKALELYYIDGADTWSEVAGELGISYSWLCRLRNEAYPWIEARYGRLLS